MNDNLANNDEQTSGTACISNPEVAVEDTTVGTLLHKLSAIGDTRIYTVITMLYSADNTSKHKSIDIRKYFFPSGTNDVEEDKVIDNLINMAQNSIWSTMTEEEAKITLLRTYAYLSFSSFADFTCVFTYMTETGLADIMIAHYPYRNVESLAVLNAYGITKAIFERANANPNEPIAFTTEEIQNEGSHKSLIKERLLDYIHYHEGEENYLIDYYNAITNVEIFPQVPLYILEKS